MNYKTIAAIGASVMLLATAGCEVQKTQEGKMPEVDVKGGQVPKYDVKTPDVNVTKEKQEVTVPNVDVHTEKREITVPKVEVTPAGEADKNKKP